jgi:hypothetical protein
MLVHVDERNRPGDTRKGSLLDRFWRPHHCDDGPVVVDVSLKVQHVYARHLLQCLDKLANNVWSPTLAEVGHTFDESVYT